MIAEVTGTIRHDDGEVSHFSVTVGDPDNLNTERGPLWNQWGSNTAHHGKTVALMESIVDTVRTVNEEV